MRILTFMLFASAATYATQVGIPQGIEALDAHEKQDQIQQMQEEQDCFISTFKGPEKNAKITAVIQEQVDSKNDVAEKELAKRLLQRTESEGYNFTSRVDCK
ncbi:MAG: hypothetical protein CME64_11665 [Halobacteriovoraceae bacterium]|nr:hypothetical protein [Halobacteriovoraceae bacterium]